MLMKWITGRYGWLVPVAAFVLALIATLVVDQSSADNLEAAGREERTLAESRAGVLAEELGRAVNMRIGALTAAKLRFTAVEDSVAERVFVAEVDSVIRDLSGLTAISVVYPSGRLSRGNGASLGQHGFDVLADTTLSNPFRRALATRKTTSSGVIDPPTGRRVVIFEPVTSSDGARVMGVLAAELDPLTVIRTALAAGAGDTIRGSFYSIFASNGARITGIPAPAEWPSVDLPVRVADTHWAVRLAYPPNSATVLQARRVATWAIGLALALTLATILLLFRKAILAQREEIKLRKMAEDAARESAEEARRRAREARDLAMQLEAAQAAAQRLSTSLDPDDIVELFLGGVAEATGADVASLYTFADEGEVLVGRKRMVLHDVGPATERLRSEDIRQVRAPVSLLPVLGEAVATGDPYIIEDSTKGGRPLPSLASGPEAAPASITIPLLIGGHTVGVASWEVYSGPRTFDPGTVAFAQALAAPAAAALRAAELFASLESARVRASWEAVRFGAVLDQMADGVVVVDSRGNIEMSNKAAEELLGPGMTQIPLEEWTARFNISSEDGRPFLPSEFPLSRALRGERVARTAFIVRSSWGGERYVSSSASPIVTPSGDAAGAAMVLRDVSDEHHYAEMLRHTNRELRRQADELEEVNQQLREATKAKDQFLAVMSHELRTPINAIMGYSDLLDLEVKGNLNAEQKAMIGRVRETSRHLLGLINEVLDLAKVGSGRIDLALIELPVIQVVERAVQQILPLATSKGLILEVSPGRDDLGIIAAVADETRLTQIVINLLSNAVKFTQQGTVSVWIARSAHRVEIHVKDSGPGIPLDQQERIFEEFYQIEGGLSRSTGGTGLGLAIARKFARLMGGDVRIQSVAGEGSEFIVELPGARKLPDPGLNADQPKVAMLVRPNLPLDELCARVLGRMHLVTSSDPGSLASITRMEEPDLLVLDALAPEYGAWRALSALHENAAGGCAVPTLLISMEADRRDQAIELCRFCLATKPVTLEAVLPTIWSAGGGRDHVRTVVLAEADPDARRTLSEALVAAGCAVNHATNGAEALHLTQVVQPDVAILGLLMPAQNGIAAATRMHDTPTLRDIPVVVLAPRELSAVEMHQLHASVVNLVRARGDRQDPLAELLVRVSSQLVRQEDGEGVLS